MKPDNYCVACKGTKNLCGLGYCPILKRIRAQHKLDQDIKQDLFGPSNEVFVGSANYPDVSWGPVVSLSDYRGVRELYEQGYGRVVEARAAMVKGKRFGGIKPHRRSVRETAEAAISTRAVDLEVNFSRKPSYDMRFSSLVQPTGASAPMKRLRVCDNPKVPRKVDSILEEKMKAGAAAIELYQKGMDNYYISSVLSVGKLGLEENRIMVPTRWSITATDDMLGKHLIQRVREFKQMNRVWLFSHTSFSNHYEIMLIPGKWEFENFEAWCPNTLWNPQGSRARISEEYEPFGGRGKYAKSQAGAYYSVRLAVLEFLERICRQARVVAFREVYEGYQVPVGVFQVRENARDAMENPERFSSVEEALGVAAERMRIPVGEYLKKSRVLGQKNLLEFM
ncbi:hypothetical protein GF415_05070 [Candidatus Micrarchaeota archaeon]|nr:hypothetical protein [Candidatus Micrarchaeota archaeon]